MSKERYNQIIDEAHQNYVNETMFSSDPTWFEPIPVMDMKTGEKSMGARQYHKRAFVDKCKTDKEFSERWGLKIEERELSLEERLCVADKFNTLIREDCLTRVSSPNQTPELKLIEQHEWLDSLGPNVVPQRRVITITYNNETIEVYE